MSESSKRPEVYYGTAKDLKRFLTACRMHFLLNEDDFKKPQHKVLFAGTLLRGTASEWFMPFVKELEKGDQRMSSEARTLFGSFMEFEGALTALCGTRDEVKSASIQLSKLRQTGSAAQYVATHRRLIQEAGWVGNAAEQSLYGGLKDNIKDELTRFQKYRNYDDLVEKVLTIDERVLRTTPGTWRTSRVLRTRKSLSVRQPSH